MAGKIQLKLETMDDILLFVTQSYLSFDVNNHFGK